MANMFSANYTQLTCAPDLNHLRSNHYSYWGAANTYDNHTSSDGVLDYNACFYAHTNSSVSVGHSSEHVMSDDHGAARFSLCKNHIGSNRNLSPAGYARFVNDDGRLAAMMEHTQKPCPGTAGLAAHERLAATMEEQQSQKLRPGTEGWADDERLAGITEQSPMMMEQLAADNVHSVVICGGSGGSFARASTEVNPRMDCDPSAEDTGEGGPRGLMSGHDDDAEVQDIGAEGYSDHAQTEPPTWSYNQVGGYQETGGEVGAGRTPPDVGASRTDAAAVNCAAVRKRSRRTPASAEVIHVRARRGHATDSHSLAERVRRERISQRMKVLQDLIPNSNKALGRAMMLDEIINYVRSLQQQVEFLSMRLANAHRRGVKGFAIESDTDEF